ncbi:MAG: hypothetical protein JWM89_2802 [Acidimicrobiales bacterium]|nr:hypothetical protein [Acidimicrobiales bacterium]
MRAWADVAIRGSGGPMRIVDLAKELDVPPSEVLQACQRLSIDGSWAGAELSSSDVVVLRAALASGDGPLDLTEPVAADDGEVPVGDVADTDTDNDTDAVTDDADADDDADDADADNAEVTEPAPGPDQADQPDQPDQADDVAASDDALPPTAAGSMPDLIEEITPEPASEPVPAGSGPLGLGPGIGPRAGGIPGAPRAPATVTPRRVRHFDRGVRASIVALVLAVAAVVGTNPLRNPGQVAAGWAVAIVLVVACLVSASRGWYRASTHPDRVGGLWLSLTVLVVGAAAAVGLGLGVWTVVRSAPADSAPLTIGKHQGVQRMRWGYKSLMLVSDTSWERPAKDEGTCWEDRQNSSDVVKRRRSLRVEVGQSLILCKGEHVAEVLDVWPVNRDADDPFPGAKQITAQAMPRCQLALDAVKAKAAKKGVSVEAQLVIERPTAAGWRAGDRDLTCEAVTGNRSGKLGTS